MNRKFCGSFFICKGAWIVVRHGGACRRTQQARNSSEDSKSEEWRHFWINTAGITTARSTLVTTITTDTSPSIPFILFVSRENGTIIDPLCLRLFGFIFFKIKIKNKKWPELLGVKFWFFFLTFFSEKAKEAYGNLI